MFYFSAESAGERVTQSISGDGRRDAIGAENKRRRRRRYAERRRDAVGQSVCDEQPAGIGGRVFTEFLTEFPVLNLPGPTSNATGPPTPAPLSPAGQQRSNNTAGSLPSCCCCCCCCGFADCVGLRRWTTRARPRCCATRR